MEGQGKKDVSFSKLEGNGKKEIPDFLKDKVKSSSTINGAAQGNISCAYDVPPKKMFLIDRVINSPSLVNVFADDQKEFLLLYQLHLLMVSQP